MLCTIYRPLLMGTILLLSCIVDAQKDTSYLLPEVILSSSTIQLKDPFQGDSLGQATKYSTFSEYLIYQPQMEVQRYGPAGSVTLSQLSSGSRHTQVVWNGFKLNNPLLGSFDLSTLSLGVVDYYSRSNLGTEILGSGAGSSVSLVNSSLDSKKPNQLAISLQSSLGGSARIQRNWQGENSQHQIRLYGGGDPHRFRYKTHDGKGINLKSANEYQAGVLYQSRYQLDDKNQLYGFVWSQYQDRTLPPTLTSETNAEQQDQAYRMGLRWQHQQWDRSFETQWAIRHERLDYLNNDWGIVGENGFTESHLKFQYDRRAMQINHGFYFENEIIRPYSLNYNKEEFIVQNRIGARFNYPSPNKKNELILHVGVNTRQDEFSEPIGKLEWKYWKNQGWESTLGISKFYRWPGLDDLYWNPGGNPDLKPENGFLAYWKFRNSDKMIKNLFYEGEVYAGKTWNLIRWHPVGPIWEPENLDEGWRAGFSISTNYSFKLGASLLQAKATWRQIIQDELTGEFGYSPDAQLSASISVDFEKLKLEYMHAYKSEAFGPQSERDQLDPLHLGYISVLYHWDGNSSIRFSIQNLYNQRYSFVPDQIEEGINGQASYSINF